MPGDVEPAQSAEAERARYDKETPDLVGEELGDNARIWREYDRVAREEDRERISNWNRGLDNLALFAGLFSAVTTAFIIESQHDTEPDYARLTFLVLNASAAGVPFRDEPFVIDSSVRTVNCLWIASLMLSLTAALIAIMGKDWIGMYASRPVCNPRQWAEIRTYRLGCVERWYMSGVIASAPVLLHMSLVLFAAGLVVFVAPDPFSQRLALGLSVAAGALYLFTVLSAVLFTASPFKSPATQAFRASLVAVVASFQDALLYRPKRHPIVLLQQATLIIGALFSYPASGELITLDPMQRARLRRGDGHLFWDRFSPADESFRQRSWRHWPVLAGLALRSSSAHLVHALPALFKSAREKYAFLRQRPHRRPWRYSLLQYLRDIDPVDRWTAISAQPTPELLALAISRLNEMSPSPDTFHSTLVALGDLPIGPKVAPLVSLAIRTRLRAEIRHNWPKADLLKLSRYILVDRNISSQPMLYYYQVASRFDKVAVDPSFRSENSLFAISKMKWGSPNVLARHCPEITTQPRGLQYVLALLEDDYPLNCDGVIILASRYWHHLGDDASFSLERELRRRMDSRSKDSYTADVTNQFGGQSGLMELLVSLSQFRTTDVAEAARAIIIDMLETEFGLHEHACLAYAFGGGEPSLSDPAFVAHSSYPLTSLPNLASALPLFQYRSFNWDNRNAPPVSDYRHYFELSLARIIIRLLSPACPERWTTWPHGLTGVSNLDLCVRCLHTQVSHPRSVLEDDSKLEVIRLMLENVVLIRVCLVWDQRHFIGPAQTTVRGTINILTAITRQLTRLMARLDTFDTGARLFDLFISADAERFDRKMVTWNLGRYLREASGRLAEQDPSAAVSMRRLHFALGALRPFCETREDLLAAWERLDLPPDACDNVPLCDLDLGEFFDRDVIAREPRGETALPAHPAENLDWESVSTTQFSLLCLEASMR